MRFLSRLPVASAKLLLTSLPDRANIRFEILDFGYTLQDESTAAIPGGQE
jgi:hypothetical protein